MILSQVPNLPTQGLLGPREYGARRARGILVTGGGVAAHPAAVDAFHRVELQVTSDALKFGYTKLSWDCIYLGLKSFEVVNSVRASRKIEGNLAFALANENQESELESGIGRPRRRRRRLELSILLHYAQRSPASFFTRVPRETFGSLFVLLSSTGTAAGERREEREGGREGRGHTDRPQSFTRFIINK